MSCFRLNFSLQEIHELNEPIKQLYEEKIHTKLEKFYTQDNWPGHIYNSMSWGEGRSKETKLNLKRIKKHNTIHNVH